MLRSYLFLLSCVLPALLHAQTKLAYVAGTDLPLVYQTTDTVATTGGGDTINTGSGNNVILGGMGADTISTDSGTDTVLGDNGIVFGPLKDIGIQVCSTEGGQVILIVGAQPDRRGAAGPHLSLEILD